MSRIIQPTPQWPSRRAFVKGAGALSVGSVFGGSYFGNIATALAAGDAHVEAIKLTPDDLSLAPKRLFENGKPVNLTDFWIWGFPVPQGDVPHMYIRSCTPDAVKQPLMLLRMSDQPLGQSKQIHCNETYAGPVAYQQVRGDPDRLSQDEFTFEQKVEGEKKLLCRYSSKHVRYIEDDLLDVTYHTMPYAMLVKRSGMLRVPYLMAQGLIEGAYEGKKVTYMGGWDRSYGSMMTGLAGRPFAGGQFAAVNAEGKREWGFVAKMSPTEGIGYYCVDGKDPVVSSNVTLEANWQPLPHDPGTQTFTKAVWRFAGVTINYEAKHGWRLFDNSCEPAPPPFNQPGSGFSQNSGDFWAGDTRQKYKHQYVYMELHFCKTGKPVPGANKT